MQLGTSKISIWPLLSCLHADTPASLEGFTEYLSQEEIFYGYFGVWNAHEAITSFGLFASSSTATMPMWYNQAVISTVCFAE